MILGYRCENNKNGRHQGYGIEEDSAIEIITFLPIAFVRKMLPNVNWLNNYTEYYSNKKQITNRN